MKWVKRKPKGERPLPPVMMRTVVFISNTLRRWANFLQQRTNGVSAPKLKWALILFCALYMSGSVYIIIKNLQSRKKAPLTITPIHVQPLLKQNILQPILTRSELTKIHQLSVYLDSLNTTEKGKVMRDSLLQRHPHLMDSLTHLEHFYFQQNKNQEYGK